MSTTRLAREDACEKANERVSLKSDELVRIRAAFDQVDRNHNGTIDQSEFRMRLLRIGISDADIASMFLRADLNHDGVIDFAEFMIWMQGDLPVMVREEVYALHGDHVDPEAPSEAAVAAAPA